VTAALFSVVLVLAASGTRGDAGKNPGESASSWHVGGFLFWLVIVIGLAAVLVAGLVLAGRRGDTSGEVDARPDGSATGSPDVP